MLLTFCQIIKLRLKVGSKNILSLYSIFIYLLVDMLVFCKTSYRLFHQPYVIKYPTNKLVEMFTLLNGVYNQSSARSSAFSNTYTHFPSSKYQKNKINLQELIYKKFKTVWCPVCRYFMVLCSQPVYRKQFKNLK